MEDNFRQMPWSSKEIKLHRNWEGPVMCRGGGSGEWWVGTGGRGQTMQGRVGHSVKFGYYSKSEMLWECFKKELAGFDLDFSRSFLIFQKRVFWYRSIIIFFAPFFEAWQALKLGQQNHGKKETEIFLGTVRESPTWKWKKSNWCSSALYTPTSPPCVGREWNPDGDPMEPNDHFPYQEMRRKDGKGWKDRG